MKFYKRLPINRKDPMDNSFVYEPNGVLNTDSTSSLQLPKGTTIQRPGNPQTGMVRYNTSIGTEGGEPEVYHNGGWERIKTNRQQSITLNTFNNGDYADSIFGPLAYDIDPTKPQNVLVIVDNVFQIAGTNYNLRKSSAGDVLTTSTTVTRNESANTTTLHVAWVGDFNVGASLSGNNVTGCVITAVSATSKTLTITPSIGPVSSGTQISVSFNTGTYVVFTNHSTPVPSVPVVVLQGFDGYSPPF